MVRIHFRSTPAQPYEMLVHSDAIEWFPWWSWDIDCGWLVF